MCANGKTNTCWVEILPFWGLVCHKPLFAYWCSGPSYNILIFFRALCIRSFRCEAKGWDGIFVQITLVSYNFREKQFEQGCFFLLWVSSSNSGQGFEGDLWRWLVVHLKWGVLRLVSGHLFIKISRFGDQKLTEWTTNNVEVRDYKECMKMS